MLSLILNSQFKSFHLAFSFVDHGQDIWLLKYYHHLHHVVDQEIRFAKTRKLKKVSIEIFLKSLAPQMN
jgi:hypothetical protein